MRRAGYEVWMVPDLEGSWEQVPSNLIDFAARDRRWAQGNLQHLGVMPLQGPALGEPHPHGHGRDGVRRPRRCGSPCWC